MAKFTNSVIILEEVDSLLEDFPPFFEPYVSVAQVRLVVMMIYLTSDTTKAVAFDFEDSVSIIATRRRISVVSPDASSYYQSDSDLCLYEDLREDLSEIIMIMSAAFLRFEYNEE